MNTASIILLVLIVWGFIRALRRVIKRKGGCGCGGGCSGNCAGCSANCSYRK